MATVTQPDARVLPTDVLFEHIANSYHISEQITECHGSFGAEAILIDSH